MVINESLEIARRYAAPESLTFLNGVLDAIAKQRKASGVSYSAKTKRRRARLRNPGGPTPSLVPDKSKKNT